MKFVVKILKFKPIQILANVQCDGERFFKGTGKALLSLITRHPDEKSDSVQVAIEAIKRAVILGEPITIHQRLTRYYNSYLVIITRSLLFNDSSIIYIDTHFFLGFETFLNVRIDGTAFIRDVGKLSFQ